MLLRKAFCENWNFLLLGVLYQYIIDETFVLLFLLKPLQTTLKLLLQRDLNLAPDALSLLRDYRCGGPNDLVGVGEHLACECYFLLHLMVSI
jgi:hypothetical protein